jgi:BTB/POZ domain/BTB And C-terminal Kelch
MANMVGQTVIIKDQRFSSILNSQEMHDIVFVFPPAAKGQENEQQGDETSPARLFAHKVMLAVGSSVFKAMFYGPISESGSTVEIVDIKPRVFLQLLTYLYTGNVDLDNNNNNNNNWKNAVEILHVANKYNVRGLLKFCVDHLILSVVQNWENALNIYNQTLLFFDECPTLEDECLAVIDRNAHNIINNNDQVSLINYPLLCLLLERDTFCAREVDIFVAVVWWAKNQIPLRKHQSPDNIMGLLGNAFFSIRFPRMTLKELVQIVVPSGLLTGTELTRILLHQNFQDKRVKTLMETLKIQKQKQEQQDEKEKQEEEEEKEEEMEESEMQVSPFSNQRRWLQEEVSVRASHVTTNPSALIPEIPHFERCSHNGMRSIKFHISRRMFMTRVNLANVPQRFSLDKYTTILRVFDLDLNEIIFTREYTLVRNDSTPRPASFELAMEPLELCPKIGYELVLSIEPLSSSSSSSSKTVKLQGPQGYYDDESIVFDFYGRVFKEEAQIDQIFFMI